MIPDPCGSLFSRLGLFAPAAPAGDHGDMMTRSSAAVTGEDGVSFSRRVFARYVGSALLYAANDSLGGWTDGQSDRDMENRAYCILLIDRLKGGGRASR
jgi:hypothetical protein